MTVRWNGEFARVWGLGDDGVGYWSWLKKRGESKKAECVETGTIGMLSQELCVYLGIERLRRGKPIS